MILVRRGQGVTGNVRVDGQLYPRPPVARRQPCGDRSQRTRDAAGSPGCLRRPAADPDGGAGARASVGALAIDPGPTATIRVLVVATNAAVTAYGGDMQALVQLAVAESNQGYVNSNVGINMELAGYTTVAYSDWA